MTPVLQALIAVVIVVIVWFALIPFFFKTTQVQTPGPGVKIDTVIIDGKIIMNNSEISVDTLDPSQVEYIALPPSNNLKGGIQYSYSLWMNKNSLTSDVAHRILTMRGLKTKAQIMRLSKTATTNGGFTDGTGTYDAIVNANGIPNPVTEALVKQPLIKFGKNENEIIVQFNTINNPSNTVVLSGDMLKILNANAWYMLTFTFQDGYDIDGFEDGVMFQFFINDKQMTTVTFPKDALVTNTDPFWMFPNVDGDAADKWSTLPGAIADVTYHNYAMTADDILPKVIKGFNNSSFATPGMKKTASAQSKYYSMSLNNALQNL